MTTVFVTDEDGRHGDEDRPHCKKAANSCLNIR